MIKQLPEFYKVISFALIWLLENLFITELFQSSLICCFYSSVFEWNNSSFSTLSWGAECCDSQQIETFPASSCLYVKQKLRGDVGDLERQLASARKQLEEESLQRVDLQNRVQSLKVGISHLTMVFNYSLCSNDPKIPSLEKWFGRNWDFVIFYQQLKWSTQPLL